MVVGSAEATRETDEGGTIDLGGIGQALARRKNWIIWVTLASLLGATAFVSIVKPRYTAEAKVLIENQETYFTRPDKTAADGTAPDQEGVLSQVQLLQSRDLARNVIRELGLEGSPEFDPQADGGNIFSRMLELLGTSRSLSDRTPEDRILDTYFADLTVFPVPKSRVVQIEFVSNDRELSAKAANTIADAYLALQSKTKRESARQVAASLASLISGLKLKLAETESKAEKFRLQSGLLVGANNLTITAQQLGDINAQLTAARSAQADSQAKSKLIRDMLRQGRLGDVPDVASNDLVRKVNEQLVTLRADLAREARTLLPGHPRIKELNAQIADLQSGLRVAADKAARTLENDARIAGSRVENLVATLEAQKKVAGTANADDVTQRQYDSEARLLKEQLEASTTKYQEALARQNAVTTPADARVVSRAVPPKDVTFPKKVPIILLSALAGFVFSAGTVVAGELMSDRVRGPAQPLPVPVPAMPVPVMPFAPAPLMPELAELRPRRRKEPDTPREEPAFITAIAPVEGVHPAVQMEPTYISAREYLTQDPMEGIAALAARIGDAGAPGQAVVTLVTCPEGVNATSAEAIALARAVAGKFRAILVNLDIHARDIDDLCPDLQAHGLVDLLAGTQSFAEVIHRDSLTRLHVVPHGQRALEEVHGLDNVLDALCETYDHVVLAIPSMAESMLAVTLAPYAEFAVLVTGEPDSAEAERAHMALSQAGSAQVLLTDPHSLQDSRHPMFEAR